MRWAKEGGDRRCGGSTAIGLKGAVIGAVRAMPTTRTMMPAPMRPVEVRSSAPRKSVSADRCRGAPIPPFARNGLAEAATASAMLAVHDPRIDRGIHDVDRQIDQDVGRRYDQHNPLNQGEIALLQRLDGQFAHAMPGEHELD